MLARSRWLRPLTAIASVIALTLASAAGAATITGLSVVLDAGNTANLFDDTGSEAGQIGSSVGIVTSNASSFTTRYAATVNSDSGTAGAVTNIVTLNASYTITFTVSGAAGHNWQLDVNTSRIGARTAVTDGGGSSAFSLSAVTGSLSGLGSITAGSLALAAITRTQQNNSVDLAFNQTGGATIRGTGNGTVSLHFTFSATAESIVQGNQGDEAAVRMGIDSTLSSYTAGDYPGSNNRTLANDGNFVTTTITDLGLVPEPSTGLLLAGGLTSLALHRRARMRIC